MLMDLVPDMIQGTGLDISSRLSLYPGSNLATKGVFPPECPNTNMLVTQIAGIPVLHNIFTFDNGTNVQFELGCNPEFTGNQNLDSADLIPDYLMWVSQSHRMWRGSIKYLVWFVTNSFTTCRLRISYSIDPAASSFGLGGDYPSRVIEVKGTTKISIQVPYLHYSVYKQAGEIGSGAIQRTPKIVFSLLTLPVCSLGDSPLVTAVVYRGGGEDMQFSGLIDSIITAPVTEVAEAQSNLQAEFKKKFDPIACDCHLTAETGYITSETTSRVVDCMRRYSPCVPNTFGAQVAWCWPITSSTSAWRNPYYYYATLFRYWRGSVRMKNLKLIDTSVDYAQYGLMDPSAEGFDDGSGTVFNYPSINPVAAFEVPWYCTYPYRPKDLDSIIPPTVTNPVQPALNTDGATQWIAAGDDFFMGYLVHLPVIIPGMLTKAKAKSKKTNSSNSSRLKNVLETPKKRT